MRFAIMEQILTNIWRENQILVKICSIMEIPSWNGEAAETWMALEIESQVLLFWIQGGGSNHVFAIRLGPSDSVVELKEAIRKKNSKVSAPAILNLGRWVHCFGIRR